MKYCPLLLSALLPGMATGSLLITGVGDPNGGTGDIIELYATADVADLSIYGIETANNGAAAGGVEFSLSGSASAGDFLYLTTDQLDFTQFFGFAADVVDGDISFNGDDSVYLYQSGAIIDVLGYVPNVDFTGLSGDYSDGWAYRNDGTGPSGNATTTFSDWDIGVLRLGNSNSETNAASPNPMPIGTFSPGTAVPEASEALIVFAGLTGLVFGTRRRKRGA